MESLNRQAIQAIKLAIIESNNIEAFNQFAENLIMAQESMKEFSRMEPQHESIFKKEEENAVELIEIKESVIEGILEDEKSPESMKTIENEIFTTNVVVIRNI
jgi:hypothetical protein